MTPAQALQLGPDAPFDVQLAQDSAKAYEQHTLAELLAGFALPPYLTTTSDGWAHLEVSPSAPTTSGSKGARAELREVNVDGSKAAWNARAGSHYLRTTVRAVQQPTEIVMAQLHDGDRDRIAVRTQSTGGSSPVTALSVRVNGSVKGGYQETIPFVNGRPVVIEIEGADDVWTVRLDGVVRVTVPAGGLSSSSTSWYFKTGCYVQPDYPIDLSVGRAAVDVCAVRVSHGVAPTPTPTPAPTPTPVPVPTPTDPDTVLAGNADFRAWALKKHGGKQGKAAAAAAAWLNQRGIRS